MHDKIGMRQTWNIKQATPSQQACYKRSGGQVYLITTVHPNTTERAVLPPVMLVPHHQWVSNMHKRSVLVRDGGGVNAKL